MKRFNRASALLLSVALATSLIGPSASAQTPTPVIVVAATTHTQAALGTSIPYQGQLKDNGAAANGVYDFQFKLYDDASAGSQVGSAVNQDDVTVANGLFSVALDFGGGAFNGEARYLEIGVRPGASTGVYTTLAPRRPLLAAPYALYSLASANSSGNLAYGSDTSAPSNAVFVTAAGNVGIGTQDPRDVRLMVRTDAGGTTNNILSFATFADEGKGSHFGIDTVNRMMYWRISDAYDYGWQFQDNYGQHARMTITKDGNVGIGTGDPHGPLQILKDGSGPTNNMLILGTSADEGKHSFFGVDTTNRMMYWRLNDAYDYGFQLQNRDGSPYMTIEKNSNMTIRGSLTVPVLRITGGDLAEPFEIVSADTIQPGMVVAIDPDNPGQMRLANTAYDHTVAGVISGAGGINAGVLMYKDGATPGSHPVALTGRVYVWADASNGAIVPGDLLTTSDTPGHAMKVTDHERAQGAILGKAMSKLAKGTGLVLVLVTLQ